jgi:hypothetical protein
MVGKMSLSLHPDESTWQAPVELLKVPLPALDVHNVFASLAVAELCGLQEHALCCSDF